MLLSSLELFAQTGGPTEMLFWLLRFMAGLGGALIGWFLSDPIARLLYRVAYRKPIPDWSLPWLKLISAGLVGVLVFFFIPLGGGPGGFGFGPGAGGAPGKGAGDGSKTTAPGKGGTPEKADAKAKVDTPTKKDLAAKKPIEIELLGGTRYQNDGKFYLLERKPPALALAEVEEYLKQHQAELSEVRILLTPESVDKGHAATVKLHKLARDYGITPNTVEP
jgi:hypothetical protein